MSVTDFHARYFACELTKRCTSDNVEKLAAVLADAQVDLNPHQVEAALFAFRSPLSKGAILADEVGLGKTIEAGLLLSQKWAERKRRLLVIVPANLRKQWAQELADEFFLPSTILEARGFNEAVRGGNLNPFQQDAIVLCSYQFARSKQPYLRQTNWDLVVIDEAHRLRNVYKNSSKIAAGQRDAREKLLDNFDQEVVEKVRIQSHDLLDRFNERLWRLTRHLLADYARFDEQGYGFTLHTNPFPGETIHPGPYRMGKSVEGANTYRVGHPLARRVLERARSLVPAPAEVSFHYTGNRKNIAILEPLLGKRGWLVCSRLTLSALETEDQLVFAGLADDGIPVDEAQCRRLFDLPATQGQRRELPAGVAAKLNEAQSSRLQAILGEVTAPNGRWFDTEMDKLDRWAEDQRASLRAELAELDDALKDAKKAAGFAPTLPEKLERQRAVRPLEARREDAWRSRDQASRDIDRQKDALLDEISRRLEKRIEQEPLFAVRWKTA